MIPNITSFTSKGVVLIFSKISRSYSSSQKALTFVQEKKRCSTVSNSIPQRSHEGESTFLNLKSISFVYKILCNILYWNSLNLLSKVVLKGNRYIFSQSNWKVCVLNLSSYLFWAVALLDIFETKFSYNDFVFKFSKAVFLPSIRR